MSDFKATMHQIRFRAYVFTRSPRPPIAGFKRPTSKGMGGEGREAEEWEGDSFVPRSGPPTFLRIYAHDCVVI